MEAQKQALAALRAEHDQAEAKRCHEAELSAKAQVRKEMCVRPALPKCIFNQPAGFRMNQRCFAAVQYALHYAVYHLTIAY